MNIERITFAYEQDAPTAEQPNPPRVIKMIVTSRAEDGAVSHVGQDVPADINARIEEWMKK